MHTTRKTAVTKVASARLVLRLESLEQKVVLTESAAKNRWTLNAEVLHRCFDARYHPKKWRPVRVAQVEASLTVRFETPEQKTELMNAAKQNMRSLNAEIVYRCFHRE